MIKMMNKVNDYENNNLMQQLIDNMIIGTISVTEEGLLNLELLIEQEKLTFDELQQIEEHFTAISEILIDYFNRNTNE